MAAFINALHEEGTLDDCRRWVDKMRQENHKFYDTMPSSEMTKAECLVEISALWNWECQVRNRYEST